MRKPSLADALMPPIRQRLLALTFGAPDRWWYLTELAAWLRESGRSRFLLTAPPLRMPGAAGSPVTPVATV